MVLFKTSDIIEPILAGRLIYISSGIRADHFSKSRIINRTWKLFLTNQHYHIKMVESAVKVSVIYLLI